MIKLTVQQKDSHGGYRIYEIFESEEECLAYGKEIVDLKGRISELKPGKYVRCIEGYYVPLLKVLTIGRYQQTFVFFPRKRHSLRHKEFSYNLDFVSKLRFRLTYNEKLFVAYLNSGMTAWEGAKLVWKGKDDRYIHSTIRNLFFRMEFVEYLYYTMGTSIKERLIQNGITEDTIADKMTEFITGERIDTATGEKVQIRVPQNLQLWALNKAVDLFDNPIKQTQPNQGTLPNQQLLVTAMTLKLSPNQVPSDDLDTSKSLEGYVPDTQLQIEA
jgi:hypothetical protein